MSTTTKKVSDSATETLHIVRPNHLNAAGRLFGGGTDAVDPMSWRGLWQSAIRI